MNAPTDRETPEQFIAKVEQVFANQTYDPSPVPQPGRPPMSQRATDASVLMLSAGAASIPIGGMTALVLHTLGGVNPVAIGLAAGGTATVLVAAAGLIRSATRSVAATAPQGDTINHIHGNVRHEHHTVTTQTRGLFAKTINETKES